MKTVDKQKKAESNHNAQSNNDLDINLEKKLAIIEKIKELNENSNSYAPSYKNFKRLQVKWNELGKVPAKEANNLWNSYRYHVDRFYNLLHLDRDLKIRDYKYNFEKKEKLIKKAEALDNEKNLERAFREIQALHQIWKEDLGPVAKEHRKILWEKFCQATKKINKKRKYYNNQIEKKLIENYKVKKQIILDINKITSDDYKSHLDLQKKSEKVNVLREKFINSGSVPKKYRKKSWADLKDSLKDFNKSKNKFYKSLKKTQSINLEKKKSLLKIIENNMGSSDLEKTVDLIKKAQNDWKKIGHVPKNESDKVWNKFKESCDAFFKHYNEIKKKGTAEENQAFAKKEKLLNELKSYKLNDKKEFNINEIERFSKEWSAIGDVPKNKIIIDANFKKLISKLINNIGISDKEAFDLKYNLKIQKILQNPTKLKKEVSVVKKMIDKSKSEIIQLENNLQFFSNVQDDNPLVVEVIGKINKQKAELNIWLEKFQKINKIIE